MTRITYAGQLRYLTVYLLTVCSTNVFGQVRERHIDVNGLILSAEQISALDLLNCNTEVPDGHYWIDTTSGAWGYTGGPQQGVMECFASTLNAERNQAQQTTIPENTGDGANSRYFEDRMNSMGVDAIVNPVYP